LEDLKSCLSTVNKESLVGLSVPLPVPEEDSAIIGYYSLETGAGHIRLPQIELKAAVGLLLPGGDSHPARSAKLRLALYQLIHMHVIPL
jgi:hypothetical protein